MAQLSTADTTTRAPSPAVPTITLARYPGGSTLIIPCAHPDHGKMVMAIMRGFAGPKRVRRDLPPIEQQLADLAAVLERDAPWMTVRPAGGRKAA